jgi:hypothetical protein
MLLPEKSARDVRPYEPFEADDCKISIYQGEPMTQEECDINAASVLMMFDMSDKLAVYLSEALLEEGWTFSRFQDAIRYLTRNHKYPKVMPADILSYDVTIDASKAQTSTHCIAVNIHGRVNTVTKQDFVAAGDKIEIRRRKVIRPWYVSKAQLGLGLKHGIIEPWKQPTERIEQ